MAKKPTVSIFVALRDQGAIEGLKALTDKFQRFSKDTAPALYVVKNATAAVAAAVSLATTAFTAATAQAMSFERALLEVKTIADESVLPMSKVRGIAMDMASAYGTKPQENAKALYEIISAGVTDSAQAMEVLHASQKLAIGGLTDTKTAVDGLTSILNAFSAQGVKAGDVVDSMFIAIRDGKTTAAELSHAIGMLAPVASAAGLSVQEMLGAVAAMTQQGVKTSTAVDYIRSALSNILKPTKEAKDAAQELGVAFGAPALASKGLATFLQDVVVKSGATREQIGKLFGSIEAMNAVFALTNAGGERFAELLVNQEHRAGAAGRAVDTMTQALAFQVDRYEALKEAATISFGEAVTKGDSARNTIIAINDALEETAEALSGDKWRLIVDESIGALVHAGGDAVGVLAQIGFAIKGTIDHEFFNPKKIEDYPALAAMKDLSERLRSVRTSADRIFNANFNDAALSEMGYSVSSAEGAPGAGFGFESRFAPSGLVDRRRPVSAVAAAAAKTKETAAARKRRELDEQQDAAGLSDTPTDVGQLQIKIAYANLEHLGVLERRRASADEEWNRQRVERFRRGRRELEDAQREADRERVDTANAWIGTFKELGVRAVSAVAENFTNFFVEMGQSIGTGGASVEEIFGKFIGGTLTQIGTMLVSLGTAAIAANLLSVIPILAPLVGPPTIGVAAGLGAIAVGTGLIAAGSAIGAASAGPSLPSTGSGGGGGGGSGRASGSYGFDRGFDSLSQLGARGDTSSTFVINFNGGIFGGNSRQVARELRDLLRDGESLMPRRRLGGT